MHVVHTNDAFHRHFNYTIMGCSCQGVIHHISRPGGCFAATSHGTRTRSVRFTSHGQRTLCVRVPVLRTTDSEAVHDYGQRTLRVRVPLHSPLRYCFAVLLRRTFRYCDYGKRTASQSASQSTSLRGPRPTGNVRFASASRPLRSASRPLHCPLYPCVRT